MKDSTYHFITSVMDLFLWGGELTGVENLPGQGPAVFIGNHSDAAGPIATACSIPLRLHYWVAADMMDKDLAPVWLQADFFERQLHLRQPLSRWLSQILYRITVPMFYSLRCVPVYRGDNQRMQEALRATVDLLQEGKFVFIFPEDPRLPVDPVTRMQPFQYSFVRLGELYYQETGQRMVFIPVATHDAGYIQIGRQVEYDPDELVGSERRRLLNVIEQEVIRMYLQLDRKSKMNEDGKLLPARKTH